VAVGSSETSASPIAVPQKLSPPAADLAFIDTDVRSSARALRPRVRSLIAAPDLGDDHLLLFAKHGRPETFATPVASPMAAREFDLAFEDLSDDSTWVGTDGAQLVSIRS
jgi:hypothetical protein